MIEIGYRANERERRRKIRVEGPIPVRVRGTDIHGIRFDNEASLDNLSTGGLYVRLKQRMDATSKLFFLIRVPPYPGATAPGMRVAARGTVRRVELQSDGSSGLAVVFTRYRVS